MLDKSRFNRLEARRLAAMADKDRKEYSGMFEAVIESFKEAREEGLLQSREEAHQEKLRTVT
ncbi:MAG: hypothetical protein FWD78_04725 [Treponema sp.]|nr:hypothetical protein [Treponema sp.]